MKRTVQKIVLAGVVAHQGKILVLQRSKDDDSFPGLWELPSGKREPFESSLNALQREVMEETGLQVEPLMPISLFEFAVEKEEEIRDVTQINYLVKTTTKPRVKLSVEHQNYAWISPEEINDYNFSDETRETIITVFKILYREEPQE